LKILNFGSLNLDYVYEVAHLVKPGETISADRLTVNTGGKGLNQSIALAKAGARVFHAGAIGAADVEMLKGTLDKSGVDTDHVKIIPGHGIEDAGDYTLEIIGLNNLHKFITFSISDLSLNGDETVVKRPEAGNMEVSAPESEPGWPVAYDEQQTPSKSIDLSAVSNWFFAFPVISTLIILLSIFKRKYER
jgi:hypothetical protein